MNGVRAQTWAFRAILLILNVCGLVWIHHSLTWTPTPRLRVLSALPTANIDTADRFSLTFDEPLRLAGMVGSPLADPPFVVQPTAPGEWVWAAPERVEYRLAQPLPPGRRFKVKPAANLERLTGRTLVGPSEFTFDTKPLRLLRCELTNADRTHVNTDLTFNQPVEPGELLRHLSAIELDGRGHRFAQKLEVQCLTQTPSERLSLHIARPESNRLRLELDGDLAGCGGELTLGTKVVKDIAADTLFALTVADVNPPGLDSTCTVWLRATRTLKDDQAIPKVAVEPALPDLSVRVEAHGVMLDGPFEPGRRYTATVSGNLLSEGDSPLGADSIIAFEIPDRRPAVEIPLGTGILSPHGNLLLDMRAAGVSGLCVRAARVHENNLSAALHGHSRSQTSRQLPEKRIPLQLKPNEIGKLTLDLRELLGSPRGIYYLDAEATDVSWVSDEAVVAVTDLAITTKTERGGLYAWVTSLGSGQPVAGAEVTAMSYNGQTLGSAVTDASGVARVLVPAGHPDGPAWVVTARLNDDVSFLRLGQRTLMAEGVDYSGRDVPKTYDAMLYTERGVYRPGDTIHLTGIVRDTSGAVPPEMPLVVRMNRPDGREVAVLPVAAAPDRQGMFQADFVTDPDGQTGAYRFAVTLPGDKEALGAGKALVEEFAPVRLEVKAELVSAAGKAPSAPPPGPPLVRGGDGAGPIEAHVAARYLFGQPGAGLAVKAIGRLTRLAFQSRDFPEFTFDDVTGTRSHEAEEVTGTLDDEGTATLELLDAAKLPPGLWRGSWAITVNETGGRSVSTHIGGPIDSAEGHLGLRLVGGRLVRTGAPVNTEWVQVLPSGEPAEARPMEYLLQRVDEDVSLERVNGRLVWKTVERVFKVAEGNVAPTAPERGPGRFELTCPQPGRYRLRLTESQSGAVAQLEFHASDEREAARMLATGEPERLDVVLDREKYAPGATAKILVRAPFPGTLLLTIEAADVVDQRVVPLTGESVELDWPVDDRLRGGAFVTATVVRAIDATKDRWMPHRAYGAARLAVDWSERELPVTIAVAPAGSAPTTQPAPKLEPGATLSVKVQAPSPADPRHPPMVQLWAVDEGILATTAYATPRPEDYFFAHRKTTVATSDVYDDLLPDYARPASMMRIGGDGGPDMPGAEFKRHSPVPSKQRAAAVVWSQLVPAGPDGCVNVDMKMPDLNGEMRLMAVVVDGDAYGSASRPVTLAAPLLVELSAPRFAAPGDTFTIPAKLFNGTGEALRVALAVESTGPVEARVQEPTGEIDLAPDAPAIVWLEGKTAGLGHCQVRIKAIGAKGGEAVTGVAEAVFPVRPAGSLHTETKLLRVKAGEPLRLDPPAGFLEGTVRRDISVSGSPTVHLQAALEDLIEYPYGCVEQTTSRLWALLYAPDLLREADAELARRAASTAPNGQPSATASAPAEESPRVLAVKEMSDAGLTRLWSMQTLSGGLAYWPGDAVPTQWGSTYAAGFIVQARRAGYRVDPGFLRDLTKYLEAVLANTHDESPDDDLRAELCYVLAALDQPPLGWMARLSEHASQLDMAGRAHLAGAWAAAGRKDRATAILTDDTLAGQVATTSGGRLVSQVRAEAVLLNVLLDFDTGHPWIPTLVERLEKARKAGRWGSTLENATALAALARFQTLSTSRSQFEGLIVAGADSRPFNQSSVTMLSIANAEQIVELQSTGQGDIFVSVTTEGLLKANQALDYDRGLKVTRKWTDRAGQPIDAAKLKVGDLIMVETTLAAPGLEDGERVENVAIVDALPGGLEVENPHLATSAEQADEDAAEPDRVEFRDDRVLLFTSAEREAQKFRYALRVINAGSFEWPAVQASCMYDEGYASAHGGAARVTVER